MQTALASVKALIFNKDNLAVIDNNYNTPHSLLLKKGKVLKIELLASPDGLIQLT
jgi:hypothetical protein